MDFSKVGFKSDVYEVISFSGKTKWKFAKYLEIGSYVQFVIPSLSSINYSSDIEIYVNNEYIGKASDGNLSRFISHFHLEKIEGFNNGL